MIYQNIAKYSLIGFGVITYGGVCYGLGAKHGLHNGFNIGITLFKP